MSEVAKIELDGKVYELPIITGTENEKAIDISKLRAVSGYITLDHGFKNTGSTTSAITFLNGEEGILRYRGYPIEQLANEASFLEVSYLLMNGDLPNKEELEEFEGLITKHTLVHEDMKRFLEAYPSNAHPMGIVSSLVSSLSTWYPESQLQDRSEEEIKMTMIRLIAKLPTIAAWAHKNDLGHPMMYPQNDLN